MNKQEIKLIIDALPSERTIYWDFPRRYELLLLKRLMKKKGDLDIVDLKRSEFRPLVHKPLTKALIRSRNGRPLNEFDLLAVWPCENEPYRLTLGVWPDMQFGLRRGYDQTSRPGRSLVLQVNMSASHRRALSKFVPAWQDELRTYHPIAGGDELTLGWIRLDICLETNEALVEEIQSDWIKDVNWNAEYFDFEDENWKAYREMFEPIANRWTETGLSAALWFLLEEIGISTVFMHTHRTGELFKGIRKGTTPKSIYYSLPRKFCFQRTHFGPLFIRDYRKRSIKELFRDPDTKWWMLDFEEWDRRVGSSAD